MVFAEIFMILMIWGQEFHGFGKDVMLWVNSRLDFGGCGYVFF